MKSPATAEQPVGIIQHLTRHAPSLQELIPEEAVGVTPKLLLDQLANHMRLKPEIAGCSHESIKNTVKKAALLGLQFGYGGNTAEGYPVPYKRELDFEPSYKGYETLAMRTGRFKLIQSYPLWEGDEFDHGVRDGTHWMVYNPCGNQTTLVGAFAFAKDNNDEVHVTHMTSERIDNLEKKTRRGNGATKAWKDWPDRMYRKTVIRRLCNELSAKRSIPLIDQLAAIDVAAEPRSVKQLSEGLE